MLIVIPIYEGDRELVVKNLEWCIALEGSVPFKAVVSHESGFDASAVISLAAKYFAEGVEEIKYYPWRGDQRWPVPQNWAWQQTARRMAKEGEPWLWWEADAIPLKEGWLNSLEQEYRLSKKPFLGAWITNNGPRDYMAGVGVYPPDVAKFCTSCYTCQSVAFDVELGGFIGHLCHHTKLIEHHVEPHSFQIKEDVANISAAAVIYHKCKDGSLISILRPAWEEKHPDLVTKAKEAASAVTEKLHDLIVGPTTKLGVIAYVPPPHVGFPQVFLDNLEDFPPVSNLFILSDYPWKNSIRIPDPVKVAGKNKTIIAQLIFNEVIKFAAKENITHFIYLESDCRVKGISWDQRLFDEFFANPKAIVGGALAVAGPSASGLQFEALFREKLEKLNELNSNDVRNTWPVMEQGRIPDCEAVVFVNGAPAVYSVASMMEVIGINGITNSKYPFDFEIGRKITHTFGPIEALTNRVVHLPGILATEGERLIPFGVRTSLLTDQKVCAVHPIKTRWRATKDEPRFYHSGDFGDIIYALASIKTFGAGQLWLGPELRTKYPPRASFNKDSFDAIQSLLECQPYIKMAGFAPKYPEIHFDLNVFRDHWSSLSLRNSTGIHTLAHMHAYVLGIHDLFTPEPWLTVPDAIERAEIVVHRSARYNEPNFPWKEILSKFNGRCLFVGAFDEHREFCRKFGNLPYYPTGTILELAQIIKGAKWFIGNQSLPCALAIGMGTNVYQETWDKSPDCVFARPNFFNQKTPIDKVPWTQ